MMDIERWEEVFGRLQRQKIRFDNAAGNLVRLDKLRQQASLLKCGLATASDFLQFE
jgi:hypothetical protein